MGEVLNMPPTLTQEQWASQLARLGVPRRLWAVPQNMTPRPKLAAWKEGSWCALILGPVGSGKTWQAVRLFGAMYGAEAEERTWNGRKFARFIDTSEAVDRMRQEIRNPELGDIVEELRRAPGLLLDDFGAERNTDFARERLSLILRMRYNDMRPTIITSNAKSLADFEPRLASRFAEGVVDFMEGRDRRLDK